MITPLYTKKNSTLLLNKTFFIFANQFSCIIEVFYIILLVLFWAVTGPANKILNGQAFTSFDYLPIEKTVNLKRFKIVITIINKYKEGLIWAELVKKFFKRLRSRLQLHHQENRVDFSVIWNFQLINKVFYPYFNLERAHVLLCQFFYNFDGQRDRIAFMKPQYGPVSNFYKKSLIRSVVVSFLIYKDKKYDVQYIDSGNVSVKQGRRKEQI